MAGRGIQLAAHSGRAALLAGAPLFQRLPHHALEELAAATRESRVGSKQRLFCEGEPAREVTLLTAGRVKITQLTSSGDVVIQRISGPGELVSGLSLAVASVHSVTPVALEPCDLLSWESRQFDDFADRYPRLQRNALRILAGRVRDLEERYSELATQRVPVRLARTLLRLMGQIGRPRDGAVVIALSREELGQMIGATLFSVSRILSQWEARGFLKGGREAVAVKDPAGLVSVAEDDPLDDASALRTARTH